MNKYTESIPILFFSNTKVDGNLKYLSGCDIEDDICVIKIGQHTMALASALEISRLKKDSKFTEIYSIEQIRSKQEDSEAELIAKFIDITSGNKSLIVPQKFPFKLATELIKIGFAINTCENEILDERSKKNEDEIAAILKVISVTKRCFEYVRSVLAKAKIANTGELHIGQQILSSEYIRNEIENFCYQNQILAEHTIVSCGKQSADPHQQGYGPIYANQFIVIDLFPYCRKSGYYGDITRTFIRGTPSTEQIKMYDTVKSAQNLAQSNLSSTVKCSNLMAQVIEFFEKNKYHTDPAAAIPYGMFHSLGHGFGLSIHEPPTISMRNNKCLEIGNVVTLEPGLYYQDIGGVRIEDDFQIIDSGAIKLSSNIPYDWIIN